MIRMINILWWMVIGKGRFVPDGPRAEMAEAEKKRTRQARGRYRRRHR